LEELQQCFGNLKKERVLFTQESTSDQFEVFFDHPWDGLLMFIVFLRSEYDMMYLSGGSSPCGF